MAIRCNGKELPITVSFHYENGEDIEITQIYPYDSYSKQDSYIEISEGLSTGIKFFADSYEHFDNEARIEIQTSLYDSTDTQVRKVYPLSIDPESNWIYRHSNDGTFPWRMGTYLINIFYKGQKYTTGFFVKPLYLSPQQVQAIHRYLEEKVEGLIYDLVYSNESLAAQEEMSLTNWYYDYARYITDHKEPILYFLLSLEKQPLSNLNGTNKVSLIPGKMDRRSIKWSTTNKGMSKNSGGGQEVYFYNRIKQVDYNHNANRWIKHVLSNWSSDLHHVIESISYSFAAVQKKLHSLHQQKLLLLERKAYLNTKREVAKTTKIDIHAQISIVEKDIQKHLEISIQQEEWITQLRSVFSRIIYLLNNSFLTEIERGHIKPVLKNNNYYQLNILYEKSKLIQKDKGDNKRYVKILKPSWQIYEYYCLFIVIDCLRQIGFSIKKNFEPNFIELYHQSLIPSGTLFELENENAVIHCWFDKYHGDRFTAEQNGDLFFAGLQKKRPDIKLDLYEKEDSGELRFKSCLIFDAKFRSLYNIHNNDYATTTYEQLTSYYNFFYLGKRKRFGTAPVVDRVICLYGSENNTKVKKLVEPLLYIKLFPDVKENLDVETRGEKEVLEELHYWLEDVLPSPINHF